jgi:hypothetical protein
LNADREAGVKDPQSAVEPVASLLLITAGIAFCIFFLASPSVCAQTLNGKVTNGIADVSVTADVMRFQARGDELQGTRLFVALKCTARTLNFFFPTVPKSIKEWR